MASNTGKGYRKGPVDDRSQVKNPKTGRWIKRNSKTGQFMNSKDDDKPFKGVRKED